MPAEICVCSRGDVAKTVNASAAKSLVSISGLGDPVPKLDQVERHLVLTFSDVGGAVRPSSSDVESLLAFAEGWDQEEPLVIHCWQGVSRSPAAAFIVACALRHDVAELRVARLLRQASPAARPNVDLVSLADEVMGRSGRMRQAIATIGAVSGVARAMPFRLPLPRVLPGA